jgi:hypothetical protein
MKTPGASRSRIAGVAIDSAMLKLNRGSIDFDSVELGGKKEEQVAVMNAGGISLTIWTVRVTGPGASAFSVDPGLDGLEIPPSRFSWQIASFHPLDTGCFDASLVVTSSAGSISIPLHGCSSYPHTPLGSDTIDFHLVRVDSCVSLVDSVANPLGDSIRLLGGIFSGSAFSSSLFPLAEPVMLPPGRSFGPISIRFCPDSAGPFAGTLTLITDHGVITVLLRGEGGAPRIEVEPPSIDFGKVPVGGFRDAPVVVSNVGTVPLHVTRRSREGAFTLAPGEPSDFVLSPGASRNLLFRFTPALAVGYEAIDTLRNDSPDDPFLLPLIGEGVEGHLLRLDTVSGAIGDTLILHLRINPPIDSSREHVAGWSVSLRVDRHALRILGTLPSSSGVIMTRHGDDIVELEHGGRISGADLLASIEVVGLSTAAPFNAVEIVGARLDTADLIGTGDGAVLLSGCIIGNAVPLARRSAILATRWDASGALAVRYRLPGVAEGTVRVVDLLARELLRAPVPGPGDQEREVLLPMSGAPPGIYFVELLVADDRSVMPVMRGR